MKTLFNVTVYSMLGWSILSATYLALPIELQEMLPQMNWITAVVSGGSTALLGTGGLTVKTLLMKAKTDSNDKYFLLGNEFLKLVDKYNELNNKYDTVDASIERNSQLLEVSLRAKLSNPLIDAKVKELIEGVLNEVLNEGVLNDNKS